MAPSAGTRKYIVERAVLKRKITSARSLCVEDASVETRETTHAHISEYFSQIKLLDVKINELLISDNEKVSEDVVDGDEELSEALIKELAKQEEYILDISSYLMSLIPKETEPPKPKSIDNSDVSSYKLHLPQISCVNTNSQKKVYSKSAFLLKKFVE